MKKINLIPVFILLYFAVGKIQAQALVCNDLVFISLDEFCTHTIQPDEILEGTIFNDCIVELDKTLPYGNGPWVPGVLGPADINLTYQVRVRHLPSGNMCWGNVKAEDKLPPVLDCTSILNVNLNAGAVTVDTADLNVSIIDACAGSTNVYFTFAGGQPSIDLTCTELGVHVVTLYATDAYGNTSTCETSIVVNDPQSSCANCVLNCPSGVEVSFDEGYNTLLPAFEAGNLSVFDVYGNTQFDPACTFQDSVYTVTFQPDIAGQSWFIRRWTWTDAGGQVVDFCEQPVIFTSNRTLQVQGSIFADTLNNCLKDAGETPISLFDMIAINWPDGDTLVFHPALNGDYVMSIPMGLNDSIVQIYLQLPSGITSICPSTFAVPYGTPDLLQTFDVGLQIDGLCPQMQATIGAVSSRRCFDNYFALNYCNLGPSVAFGATLTVELAPEMELISANFPYSNLGADTYLFEVGDVAPFSCGTINLTVKISCEAQLGQTVCASVTAFPYVSCEGEWQGIDITTDAVCSGDSVTLTITNRGQQNMTEALDFIVIEDFIMYQGGTFQLNMNESMEIKVPSNGSTWRIEADQPAIHPNELYTAAAVEGCGGINTPGAINAFAQSDNESYFDEECMVVTGSYDPNDKSAVPSGFGEDHIIRANDPIEYKIRFQNTGTDTAFRVVIVDTLSTQLDLYSLELGASSHPYRMDIVAGGILNFVFDPIALPDSNHNEAASHGFVNFRIKQQPDLPNGTKIENTAAIYFDFNEPVITNTVQQTIGQPYLVLKNQTPHVPGVAVQIAPNPFNEQAALEISGTDIQDGQLTLLDVQGRVVRTVTFTGNRVVLLRQGLAAGMYFYQITDGGVLQSSGKVQVH